MAEALELVDPTIELVAEALELVAEALELLDPTIELVAEALEATNKRFENNYLLNPPDYF